MHSAHRSRVLYRSLLPALALALSAPLAQAQVASSPEITALSRCVAESSNGRDRKDLARWLFVAMSAHPEMSPYAKVDGAVTEEVSRKAAALFTRLLADACGSQTKAALKSGGPVAIQAAFTVLGQLAMQELMADPNVANTMGALERYLDRSKLDALSR